jgi:hypothetical protein
MTISRLHVCMEWRVVVRRPAHSYIGSVKIGFSAMYNVRGMGGMQGKGRRRVKDKTRNTFLSLIRPGCQRRCPLARHLRQRVFLTFPSKQASIDASLHDKVVHQFPKSGEPNAPPFTPNYPIQDAFELRIQAS